MNEEKYSINTDDNSAVDFSLQKRGAENTPFFLPLTRYLSDPSSPVHYSKRERIVQKDAASAWGEMQSNTMAIYFTYH